MVPACEPGQRLHLLNGLVLHLRLLKAHHISILSFNQLLQCCWILHTMFGCAVCQDEDARTLQHVYRGSCSDLRFRCEQVLAEEVRLLRLLSQPEPDHLCYTASSECGQ